MKLAKNGRRQVRTLTERKEVATIRQAEKGTQNFSHLGLQKSTRAWIYKEKGSQSKKDTSAKSNVDRKRRKSRQEKKKRNRCRRKDGEQRAFQEGVKRMENRENAAESITRKKSKQRKKKKKQKKTKHNHSGKNKVENTLSGTKEEWMPGGQHAKIKIMQTWKKRKTTKKKERER